MKEIANRYTIALLSVLMVCLLAAPAMACTCSVSTSSACSLGTNGTVRGTVHVDGDNHPDTIGIPPDRTFYSEFDVPNGTIKWARLYWHIWGGTYYDYGWSNATFRNDSGGTFTNNRFIDDENCYQTDYDGWYKGGCGTHWLYWNVTDNVSVGHNNLTVNNGDGNLSWDGRVMYMVLVVVLDDMAGYPLTNYWINQGYVDTGAGDQHTTWFNGPINNTTDLTLWHLALCSNGNMSIWFNENLVKNYPYGTGFGSDLPEPTPELINKSWVNDSAQNMTWENIADAWFHPVMAILVDYTPADLIVTGITDPDSLRPDKNSTVNATIQNVGSADIENKFNVSLYIDGDLNDTQSVSSLGAGNSTTVSFTKVNESYGCHSFRVFVNSDGNATEGNYANNNMTKDIQVGYVIDVEKNSDFDDLVTESENGAFGDGNVSKVGNTYYIQNFTGDYAIENCNGNGITIENTDATFVIRNCTIENCTYSGVKFHNLSYGTIDNSTVTNNTEYGIEVGEVPLDGDDPNYVNITCNTINETKTDVLLIVYNATVIGNTIHDNTVYAIYLFGNDSNITCNMIEGNTDYAIKAYNSSRNNIYCNTFIDNNAGSPGHQAWDNWNSNNWNSTELSKNYIGNRWKDWQSNSGYPSTYDIDGGSNVDERPRGLYDFLTGAGEDKWAFRYQVDGSPGAGDPSIEFTETQYVNISADDALEVCDVTTTDGYYAAHRFNFSTNDSCTCPCINESALDMGVINVTWIGKGDHDSAADGAKLRIYNFTSGGYEQLDSTTLDTEVTLTGEKTSSISSYISATNNVTILVNQTSAQTTPLFGDPERSHICTDYVRLVVTPDP